MMASSAALASTSESNVRLPRDPPSAASPPTSPPVSSRLAKSWRAHDPDEPFPPTAMRVQRGKTAGTQKVSLPEGFLVDRLTNANPPGPDAELLHSGG